MVLTLPMLTLYANLMGLLGGCLMAWGDLGITIPQFLRELQTALSPRTFWIGVIKAPFFAAIIAMSAATKVFRWRAAPRASAA